MTRFKDLVKNKENSYIIKSGLLAGLLVGLIKKWGGLEKVINDSPSLSGDNKIVTKGNFTSGTTFTAVGKYNYKAISRVENITVS